MIGMNFTGGPGESWPTEVTHVRLWDNGVAWRNIHTAVDTYDWSVLDALVDKAAGKTIVYTVGGCPQWLAKYPDQPYYAPWLGPGSNSMPWSMDEANKFFWNLATRYAGRIKAYEIWNEPQLADFLYPYNVTECNALATMTKRAYSTIKACDPNALVLAASVLPRTSSGGMTRAQKYLTALQSAGWNIDAFTTHIYPEVGYWAPKWKTMLNDVVATITAMNPPTTKLWITETLFGLLGPELTDLTALDTAVSGLYTNDGGRFVFWYAWDRPDLGGSYLGPNSPTWESIKVRHTL